MRLHFGHLIESIPNGRVLSGPDLLITDSGLPCDTFNVVAAALRPDCPLQFFVGYWKGEPVSTAELTVAPDGVAGFYSLATLREFRGHGFGSVPSDRRVSRI